MPARPALHAFLSRLLVALLIAGVLTGGAVGAGLWYAKEKVSEIPIFDDEGVDEALSPEPDEPGDPANFLIIGSDSRKFVDSAQEEESFGGADEVTGQRSDTIMVVHVDPKAESGMVLSFPRDLWVNIPGLGEAKINAAYNEGVDRLIDTIEENFDIPIHHALEVDFAGFASIVDAIGTIPVYFPRPARDRETGLNAPLGGCHSLGGRDALAYVRSRNYEEFISTGPNGEGYWDTDPRADIGRIARQQYFIRTLADTALDKSRRNPIVATRLLNETVPNLTRDRGLGLSDFQRLVRTFRDLDPTVVPMETVPYTAGRSDDGQSILILDAEKAAPIFERMRTFSEPVEGGHTPPLPAPDITPAEVSVRVLNGSGTAGVAREAFDALGLVGFEMVGAPADAESFDHDTTEVRHEEGRTEEAYLVLLALGGRGELVEVDGTGDAEVEVVLGRDYEGVAGPPGAGSPAGGGTGAASPDAGSGSSTSTSTTVPPVVQGALEGLPQEMPLLGCPPGL